MSRAKVKVKKIKVGVGMKDEGIAEMFNQMLGTGSVNLSIAYPKYKRIQNICDQLVGLFEMVAKSPFMVKRTQFTKEREELTQFCINARTTCAELFSVDLSDYEWNLSLVEAELQTKFTMQYEKVKTDKLIGLFVIMCDRLVEYKKNFENENEFRPKFINAMPGVEWKPFPFSGLNLKQVFSMLDLTQVCHTASFFMTVLHKSYKFSRQLFQELQSPDIDVDQFVEVITTNLKEIQKQPELHRCREAFQKLNESVDLLKNNFNGYYRDFVGTKDSTIIMQNFILDVGKSTNSDASVTAQFRKIIAYYRKASQQQSTNPKLKMLFDKVNETFKDLDKKSENIQKDENGETTVPEKITNDDDDSDMIIMSPVAKSIYDIQTSDAAFTKQLQKDNENVINGSINTEDESKSAILDIDRQILTEVGEKKKLRKK